MRSVFVILAKAGKDVGVDLLVLLLLLRHLPLEKSDFSLYLLVLRIELEGFLQDLLCITPLIKIREGLAFSEERLNVGILEF